MKILILGGTRFLGKQVAEILIKAGHDLTLLSRRPMGELSFIRQICAERAEGLKRLRGQNFDLVLDFICYNGEDLDQLSNNIEIDRYVLISTTWLTRLWPSSQTEQLVQYKEVLNRNIPKITLNYLIGKLQAENNLIKLRDTGIKSVTLRLPIMLGVGDHTGRLNFYVQRLKDGGPLILVEGGKNKAQIAVMEDLAEVIVKWSIFTKIERYTVWEALPGESQSVRQIIHNLANASGIKLKTIDLSINFLKKYLPNYLEKEPLWRESELIVSKANIYNATSLIPETFGNKNYINSFNKEINNNLRDKELKLVEKIISKKILN